MLAGASTLDFVRGVVYNTGMTQTQTFSQWYGSTLAKMYAHPTQRPGQVFFNELYRARPDIADAIRGTRLDPFHLDTNLTLAVDYVLDAW